MVVKGQCGRGWHQGCWAEKTCRLCHWSSWHRCELQSMTKLQKHIQWCTHANRTPRKWDKTIRQLCSSVFISFSDGVNQWQDSVFLNLQTTKRRSSSFSKHKSSHPKFTSIGWNQKQVISYEWCHMRFVQLLYTSWSQWLLYTWGTSSVWDHLPSNNKKILLYGVAMVSLWLEDHKFSSHLSPYVSLQVVIGLHL